MFAQIRFTKGCLTFIPFTLTNSAQQTVTDEMIEFEMALRKKEDKHQGEEIYFNAKS